MQNHIINHQRNQDRQPVCGLKATRFGLSFAPINRPDLVDCKLCRKAAAKLARRGR